MNEQLQKPQPRSRLRQRATEEVKLAARMTKAQRVTSSVPDVTGARSTKHRVSTRQRANTDWAYTTPFSSVNSRDLWLSSFAKKERFPNQLLLHPLKRGSERQRWRSDYPCCYRLATPACLEKQARAGDFKMQLGGWIKMAYSFKKIAKPHF